MSLLTTRHGFIGNIRNFELICFGLGLRCSDVIITGIILINLEIDIKLTFLGQGFFLQIEPQRGIRFGSGLVRIYICPIFIRPWSAVGHLPFRIVRMATVTGNGYLIDIVI